MYIEAHLHADTRLATELWRDEHLAAERGQPVARFYVVRRGLALGPRDQRLPGAAAAAARLLAAGVEVVARPSGGLAVGLTDGVLNLTLGWPAAMAPSLEDAFAELSGCIRRLLEQFGLRAEEGEVRGGFCPGSTDLAVGGRKIAGLAQRRRRQSVFAHAFLWVREPHPLPIVEAFYRLAGGETPELSRDAMVSLAELIGRGVDPIEVAARLARILREPR